MSPGDPELISDSFRPQFSSLQRAWDVGWTAQSPGKTAHPLLVCYCWSPPSVFQLGSQHPGRDSSSLSLAYLFNLEIMCLLFRVNGHPYFKGSSHTDYKQKPQLCEGTDLLRGFLSLNSQGTCPVLYLFQLVSACSLSFLSPESEICCPYPSPTAQSEVCVCTLL